jgi:S-adenosylmethionine-dependent methyltransferase
VIDTRGVRIFADFVPRQRLQDPAFFQELTSLEILAAAEFPLNRMARYLHLVALKPLT